MFLSNFRNVRILNRITPFTSPCFRDVNKTFGLPPIIKSSNSCTSAGSLGLYRYSSSSSHMTSLSEATVRDTMQRWLNELNEAEVPESESSLRHIFGSVLKCPQDLVESHEETKLSQHQLDQIENLVLCRLSRMPVQYIIQEWDFLDMTLKMMPPVFIPRPETESLVLLASEQVPAEGQFSCLEVGCGSGAISLGLLKRHLNVTCTAVDVNPLAVALTKANAEIQQLDDRLKVFQVALDESGWKPEDKLPAEKYDMIVSNPPYIPTSEISSLAPEVTLYEDYKAVDGGLDGMRITRLILEMAPTLLKPGGTVVLEVDHRQPEQIEKEASSTFKKISCHKDCFGVTRLVLLKQ